MGSELLLGVIVEMTQLNTVGSLSQRMNRQQFRDNRGNTDPPPPGTVGSSKPHRDWAGQKQGDTFPAFSRWSSNVSRDGERIQAKV